MQGFKEGDNRTLPIRDFSIHHKLEDIPEPEPCALCDGETEKAIAPYRVDGSQYTVECKEAPGYECAGCGACFYDRVTGVELIRGAIEALDPVKDKHIIEVLLVDSNHIKEGN